MTFAIAAEPVPLEKDAHGTIRLTGSRVTLDSVIISFKMGETAEQINESFPTLTLADIYAVISYYLRHQSEVETYLDEQEAKGEELRRQIEAHYPTAEVRARVLARWNKLQQEKDFNATDWENKVTHLPL